VIESSVFVSSQSVSFVHGNFKGGVAIAGGSEQHRNPVADLCMTCLKSNVLDTCLFGLASPAGEADTATELNNQGNDTLNFASQTIDGNMRLALSTVQNVHTDRTLQLNSGATFENVLGGAGNDTLIDNGLANRIVGNGGNDGGVYLYFTRSEMILWIFLRLPHPACRPPSLPG